MPTVQELAEQLSRAFEGATRSDGPPFRRLKPDSPEWMTDVIREAHDHAQILPDDHRYEFCEAAADAIAEADEDADPSEARDALEADVYTGDLTTWLASSIHRVGYLDDALELGCDSGFNLLAGAQIAERQEVFDQLLEALTEMAEAEAEDAETTT